MKFLHAYVLILGLMACSGCPPQPVPTQIDMVAPPASVDMGEPVNYGFAVCPLPPDITMDNSCESWFTASGLNCVNCPGENGCFDSLDVVYCVQGGPGCQDDPNCFYTGDGSEGIPGSKTETKRKAPRPIRRVVSKLKRKS